MRRTTGTALAFLIAAALALLPGAPAKASGTPPGYAEARADLIQDGRDVGRLVLAGDARALFARFTPEYAQEVSEESVRELLGQVLATGPIGARRGESALPLGTDRRAYAADHEWAGGVLAIEVAFDARGRIAGLGLEGRTPLPPDPGAGRDVQLRLPVAGTWWVYWGGPTERQNYHAPTPDQRHAYDLVQWRRGGTARGKGTRNRDYFAFDRRVVAPADGVVVEAQDGVRDNRPLVEGENPAAPAGNHSCSRWAPTATSCSPTSDRAGSASGPDSACGRESCSAGSATQATRPSRIFTSTSKTAPRCSQGSVCPSCSVR
jgi:hypothetical protein